MNPLMISSARNHEFDRDLLSLGGIDSVHLSEWKPTDHRVVYFRCPFETELDKPIFPLAISVEKHYIQSEARIVNPPSRTWAAHRKDMWYPNLQIKAPDCIPSPTIYEAVAAMRSGQFSYPVIYRLADSAGGQGVFLCKNESDLFAAHAEISSGKFFPHWRTLLADFLTEMVGPFYSNVRVWVIDRRVWMWRRFLNRDWIYRKGQEGPDLIEAEEAANAGGIGAEKIGLALKPSALFDIYSVDMIAGKLIDINPMSHHSLEAEERAPWKKGFMRAIHDYLVGL